MDHEVWLVIKSLATFYEVVMINMHRGEWNYSDHDCNVIEHSINVMSTMYKKLALRYMVADGPSWLSSVGPRWKWTSKHHHVLHVPEQARLQCMHLGWGYMSEGFMGTMKKVGESCRHAFKAVNRTRSICHKWAMGTAEALRHCEQDGIMERVLDGHADEIGEGDDDHEAESVFGVHYHEAM